MAEARRVTDGEDRTPHYLQQRHHLLQGVRCAGSNHRKRAGFCPMDAAADRAINQRNAFLSKPRGNALHCRAANGGHFDIGPHRARHSGNALGAQSHALRCLRTRQARKYHAALRSNRGDRAHGLRPRFRRALHGFSAGIKHQHALARIALRPIRHARCNRATHGAQTQKTDAFHFHGVAFLPHSEGQSSPISVA